MLSRGLPPPPTARVGEFTSGRFTRGMVHDPLMDGGSWRAAGERKEEGCRRGIQDGRSDAARVATRRVLGWMGRRGKERREGSEERKEKRNKV